MRANSTMPTATPREFQFLARVPVMALQAQRKPLHYRSRHGGQVVETQAVAETGHDIARVADAGVMCWTATALHDRHRTGRSLEEPVVVRTAALLAFLGSGGGNQRQLLAKAISRLQHTRVTYILGDGGQRGIHSFTLLQNAVQDRGDSTWTFEIDRFFQDEVRADRTLDISTEALRLKGLKRRLYSLARERLGAHAQHWEDPFRFVYDKSGSSAGQRRFRQMLHAAVADDDLPDYQLKVRESSEGDVLLVSRRNFDASKASDTPGESANNVINLSDLVGPEDVERLAAEDAQANAAPHEIIITDYWSHER